MTADAHCQAAREALATMRFESARRRALAAVATPGAGSEALFVLHEALKQLCDFAACEEVLSRIPAETEDTARTIARLRAENFRRYATASHYRTSRERDAGLTVDEFIEKYRKLAADTLRVAGSETVPSPAVAEITSAPRPVQSTGTVSGQITAGNGKPIPNAVITLGLQCDVKLPDPRYMNVRGLGYDPVIPPVETLRTVTDSYGEFRFGEVPVGRHEFLAVTLDPSRHAIATRFIQHGVKVHDHRETRIEREITDWTSAPALPAPTVAEVNASWRPLDVLPMRNPFDFDFPRQVVEWQTPHADDPHAALVGPDGNPIPFQRTESGLIFFAELPGRSERAYGLFHRTPPSEVRSAGTLEFVEEGMTAVLDTGNAAFRVAWGGSRLPPLLSVRGPDGLWRGEGRWILPEGITITGTRSRVVERGPIRLCAEIITEFSTGATQWMTVTAFAGEPYVLVRETSCAMDGAAFEFSLREFSGGRSYLHWVPETGASRHWSSLEPKDNEFARLQESVPWWIPPAGFGCAVTMDGLESRDYIGLFTVRRGEWQDHQFAAICNGPGNDPAWHRELDWPYPEMVGSTISMVTAETRQDGDVAFRFRCFDGERQWGLLASDFSLNDGPKKELSAIQHKVSSPRLGDFVKWHLDEADTHPRPHVMARPEDLLAMRRKLDDPNFADAIEAVRSAGTRGAVDGVRFHLDHDPAVAWRRKLELLAIAPVRARMTLLGRDHGDLYSPVGGRPITHYAEDFDVLAPSGVFNADEERQVRSFLMLMGHLYLVPDLMNWHFNSRNANFEADRVDIVGTIGVTFPGNADAGHFARHARELMERSFEIYCTPGSGKWYENPACYYLHAGKCRLNIALHLANHGWLEPASLPRLKDFLLWGIRLLTPRMPAEYEAMRDGLSPAEYNRAQKVRRIAPIGDHAELGKPILDHAALLAPFYRDSDPEFADLLIWAHREAGGGGGPSGARGLFLARMDAEILTPKSEFAHRMASRRLEGFGAVFRGHFGSEKEFFLLLKLGPGGYRYHRTEGSIILFADGKPLVYDGGEGGETWRHSTLSFFDTHLPLATGHVERFATLAAMDFCQGVHPTIVRPGEPVFLSDDCHHDLVPIAFARYREPRPANTRTVQWIKDDYVVMHDALDLDPSIPSYWHLQVVADCEQGDAECGWTFRGRFGTNLQVLLPGPPLLETSIETSPLLEFKSAPEERFAMRHLRVRRDRARFYAAILRPLAPDATPVEAEISDDGERLHVRGDGMDDYHFFHRTDGTVEVDGVRFSGRYGSVLGREETRIFCLPGGGSMESETVQVFASDTVQLQAKLVGSTCEVEATGHGEVRISTPAETRTLNVNDWIVTVLAW